MKQWFNRRRKEIRSAWLKSRAKRAAKKNADSPLREFVYLDDVSVYSLLSSRIGAVADSITEMQASTLSTELTGSGKIGEDKLGSLSGGARLGYSRNKSRQVLRKATIQSTFRELSKLEEPRTLGHPGGELPPPVASDWMSLLETGHGHWVIPAAKLQRGQLIELEVELDSEALYEFVAIFSTVAEATKRARRLFGDAAATIDEVEEGMELLRILLAGLVPVIGRVKRYVVIRSGDKVALIRRELVAHLPESFDAETRDLQLVGVTEEDLYWLDLRRVLFSRSTYTVLARISSSGLQTEWNPVKLMDLLGRVDPSLPLKLSKLALGAHQAVLPIESPNAEARLSAFADLASEAFGWNVDDDQRAQIAKQVALESSITDYDSEVEATNKVLDLMKPQDAADIDHEQVPALRRQAEQVVAVKTPIAPSADIVDKPFPADLIDAEIIGIYW